MDKQNAIRIDYKDNQIFDWNSVLHIEDVIPLETDTDCIVGYASKCLVCKSRIVYFDSKQRVLFIFDNQGKFLYKIDALGGGDKEYTMIKDVNVSTDEHNIWILDNTSILSFDMATGAFLDRISLDKISSSFYQFMDRGNGKFYFWSTDSDNSLYTYDGKVLVPIKKRKGYPFVGQKFYVDSEGNVNLLSDYGYYSIETVSEDSLQAKYTFDFGRWNFPKDGIPRTGTEFRRVDKLPYFKGLLSAFETNGFLYVSTATPDGELYSIVMEKASSRVFSGKQDTKSPVVIIGSDQTYFYGILYPSLFVNDTSLYGLIEQYHISEESNPLLIKFRFDFEGVGNIH